MDQKRGSQRRSQIQMNCSRIFLGMGICLCLLLPIACYRLPDFCVEYFNLSNGGIWIEVHGLSPSASPGWVGTSRNTDRLSSKTVDYSDHPPTIDDVITISWSKAEDSPKQEIIFKRSDYRIPRHPWYGKLTVIFTAAKKWELKYTIEEKNSRELSK